ncbi:urea carboxylase [Enterococcus pallens]|uniref:Urea carboxylase n=1 Tax=Enterococcus pallens ATCC BAA-351 TaxID=1158607 RepID=R2S5Y2_9ENTE|nr:urea carboxylase [Enterococcus pallens]EOH90895.1 urea carboxylase [Enterococcus pallens ATCC BAA-351]EOU16091.1 urea carboxylase [Enterococcus pallens ATCC BAA-351]OJG77448.1 urea carboxylase [Enterococcus pallens]
MFKKVLIANRGTIAVRIIRTLKKMKITAVAVYAQADEKSLHVELADESYLLEGQTVNETYLDTQQLLMIAQNCQAEAIIPGYGFLSENADFVEQCNANGIVFIGPESQHIREFGMKHLAREYAQKAGVPMIEGTELLNHKWQVKKAADTMEYPIMLKSTAGGGGIGVKICQDQAELLASYDSVVNQAEANFGNGGVFLEKYVENARHIEVQIFGNAAGDLVTVGERDCSLQRRNQKVIEECPAFGISEAIRQALHQAAKQLGQAVGYRSAGTVEFLYDTATENFYFLEVNTRLQVEHGITEEVFQIDLVEWMIKEAANEFPELGDIQLQPQGVSLEARIYAEDFYHHFRPSLGKVDEVSWSSQARIETFISDQLEISSFYDPMLAKIITKGETRQVALSKLAVSLEETQLYGLETNLYFLQEVLKQPQVIVGDITTKTLEKLTIEVPAIEVLDGGLNSTLQDYPGRVGYWGVGVPPSGSMDTLSGRLANKLLGNAEEAPVIELTLSGGKWLFRGSLEFALTGADLQPELDGQPIPMYQVIQAEAGQVLSFGESVNGMRSYLAVKNGFSAAKVLGSASCFTLGNFGGKNGRALQTGDVLHPLKASAKSSVSLEQPFQLARTEQNWLLHVTPGPHCTPEFLDPSFLKECCETKWEVHFNSSRTGVRLIGPTPKWAREDGGEAGLHPSNIHDNAYAVGTVDFTGDMPIILGPDGPSLGGFVCPATVITSDLWKLGQLKPGDTLQFRLVDLETANLMNAEQDKLLARPLTSEVLTQLYRNRKQDQTKTLVKQPNYPIFYQGQNAEGIELTIRLSGDQYLLLEYGEMELDFILRVRIHALYRELTASDLPIVNLTPGIRSLQIQVNTKKMSLRSVLNKVVAMDNQLPDLENAVFPSRVVKLPLSWNDPQAVKAMERYQGNVRPDAPWCPDNIEFIRRINGLKNKTTVQDTILSAKYMVLGLGDVYLGAPVAVPINPIHRLVTTKYNPARTWTPENAVGIGGAYLCVYGMEGPGGYQLFGRTIQMWNLQKETDYFSKAKPWLLDYFDQLQFFLVSPEELLQYRKDFVQGNYQLEIEETEFSIKEYLQQLSEHQEEIEQVKKRQQTAFEAEREDWRKKGLLEFVPETMDEAPAAERAIPENNEVLKCAIPGSVWKILVGKGDYVKSGEPMIVTESMKTEIAYHAPCDGKISEILIKQGDILRSGESLAFIEEV